MSKLCKTSFPSPQGKRQQKLTQSLAFNRVRFLHQIRHLRKYKLMVSCGRHYGARRNLTTIAYSKCIRLFRSSSH